MRYIFNPEAVQEYEESAVYYRKISRELAISFINSVEKGIEKILENPKTWPIIEEDVRPPFNQAVSFWYLLHYRERLYFHIGCYAHESQTGILEKSPGGRREKLACPLKRFWLNLQNNWELSLLNDADFAGIKPIAA